MFDNERRRDFVSGGAKGDLLISRVVFSSWIVFWGSRPLSKQMLEH